MPAATIETPEGSLKVHVCKDGTADNTDWVSIYEISFPPEQRQDIQELRAELDVGFMELDETRDENDNILCMTLTEVFNDARGKKPNLLMACYTAVFPKMRGLGIGSIHRRNLGELLKKEYPEFLGIFSEIESTKEANVDAETMLTRTRRKAFFMRLGLIPIEVDYYFPSYEPGGAAIAGELLWVPFGPPELQVQQLEHVLQRIYVEGYKLNHDDPLIDKVARSVRRKSPASSMVALG